MGFGEGGMERAKERHESRYGIKEEKKDGTKRSRYGQTKAK